jgi:Tol biopolymer transport system component
MNLTEPTLPQPDAELTATGAARASGTTPVTTSEGLVLLSDNIGGGPANGDSSSPSVSGDGRWVAFASRASDLVADDTNNRVDIFVADRATGAIERVSLGDDGIQAKSHSTLPDISANGDWVSYQSTASNLVAGDRNGVSDVFVFDRDHDSVQRVSFGLKGAEANGASGNSSISTDGRLVAFDSLASNLAKLDKDHDSDVFLWDRSKHAVELASFGLNGHTANAESMDPQVSANGRYVAYASYSTNLVEGDTNHERDVFVYDRLKHTIERVSIGTDGTQGNGDSENPSISGDGRYVSFSSTASNLVAGDTNNHTDVFVYDRLTDELTRASTKANGAQINRGSGESHLSDDGHFLSFISYDDKIVPHDANGERDVFLKNLDSGEVELISTSPSGGQPSNGTSYTPNLSADGHVIVFDSASSTLVAGDTNVHRDVFGADLTTVASTADIFHLG